MDLTDYLQELCAYLSTQMALARAIIDGGPCGLTLAHLLECKGIDYVVYERDESEQSTGTDPSLNIRPEIGQRALREGELFDAFQKYARYEDTVFTLTKCTWYQIQ